MRDYYQDQPLLKAEAYGILRELALMDLLAMCGRPYLVGSVPLRTIAKLDIYYHRGEYCRGMGYRIYQAVLDQGVRSVDEFKRLMLRKVP